MPASAPLAAIKSANRVFQGAAETRAPLAKVVIGGDPIPCAGHMGGILPQLQEDGLNTRNEQRAVLWIDKSRLPVQPTKWSAIYIDGVQFDVRDPGPVNAHETAWRVEVGRFV